MLTVVDRKTKKEVYYDYEYIYECMSFRDRNEFLKDLYIRNKKGEIYLYCTCIKNKEIPLIISKRELTYYIKRKNINDEHALTCKFDGEYLDNLRAWVLNNDEVFVSLKDRKYRIGVYKNPRIKDELDIKELYINWLNIALEDLMINKNKFSKEEYIKNIFKWTNKIKFEERVSLLNLIAFNLKDIKKLNNNGFNAFGFFKFINKEKIKNEKDTYILYLDNFKGDILQIKYTSKNFKDIFKQDFKCEYIVGGILEAKENDELYFKEICIIPTTKNYVYVKNKYEFKLFNEFDKKNRRYVTSYNYFNEFTYNKPNAILVDTQPFSIVEIMEEDKSNKEYYDKKILKLHYFRTLKDYKLIIWDGYNNEKLFKFHKIASKID